MLYLKCEGQVVRIEKDERLADKYINANTVHFEFCERWKGMKITAQFTQKQGEEEKTFNVLLDEVTHTVTMPNEIIAGDVDISAFGVHPETGTRLTSIPVRKKVDKSGFVGDGETPIPPTPDLYNQLLQKIDGAFGDDMQKAVNEYLEENPVAAGATAEEAAQIKQNTQDISAMKKEVGRLIGDTSTVTPSEVYEALQANKDVTLTTTIQPYGRVTISDFVPVNMMGQVSGHCIMQAPDPVNSHVRSILCELVGSRSTNNWFTYVTTIADSNKDIPSGGSGGLEPLVGTTDEVTPTEVVEAIQAGRAVCITANVSNLGERTFTSFAVQKYGSGTYSIYGGYYGGNIADKGLQYVNLVGHTAANQWSAYVSYGVDTYSKLPNPEALTFTGAVTETYNGSSAKTVNIPTVPNALPNPNALTIKDSSGSTLATYDGSQVVTLELPESGGGSGGTVAPLMGTTSEITPQQVINALGEGRSVLLSYTHPQFGVLRFTSFIIAETMGMVASSGVFYMDGTVAVMQLAGMVEHGMWECSFVPLATAQT